MKKLCFLLILGILSIEGITEVEAGFSIGLKGSYGIPLGKFSEVGEPYVIAGQKAARPSFGIGGVLEYQPPLLSGTFGVRGKVEYLQMDDKSVDFVSITETGDTLGTTDFKYRIIPVTVAVRYLPFAGKFKLAPFLGLGGGAYFYSYVNTGYDGRRTPYSELFGRTYTRFGMDFEAGSRLSIFNRWSLDAALDYHVVFLHNQDTIGVQSNLPSIRFFQISTSVLYRI